MQIDQEHNAGKDPFKGERVDELLGKVKNVVVTSGKKIFQFDPKADDREEILKRITGRTGNLRAPTLRKGDTLYVGFTVELYESLAKEG